MFNFPLLRQVIETTGKKKKRQEYVKNQQLSSSPGDLQDEEVWLLNFQEVDSRPFCVSGSSFVVSMGSFLDVSNWLNPAKLTLYYQTNSSTQWLQDFCGQRATEPCEQLCDEETGESAYASQHMNIEHADWSRPDDCVL